MHTIEIPDINFSTTIPENMDELKPKEFLFLAYLITQLDAEEIKIEEMQTLMILFLLGIKHTGSFTKLPEYETLLIAENVNRLKDLIHYVFVKEEINGKKRLTINLNFTKNHIPKIKTGRTLFGPSDALQNITFQEYIDAHTHFIDFIQTKDTSYLDNLIAVLYREKRFCHYILKKLPNYNGQIRRKYNDNNIEQRARKIKKIPFYKKYAIFLFFSACNEFLKTGELNINSNPINLKILYDKDPSDQPTEDDGLGLAGILYKLAETSVFGNIEQTAKQNLYDVLLRLYQQRKEYISFKKNSKKND